MDGGATEGGTFSESPSGDKAIGILPFVVLSLSGETFAIGINKVREIIRVPRITWIPGVSDPVSGIINLRGSIVAVIDLSKLLSHQGVEAGDGNRIVVVESGGSIAGLLVDAVSEVADILPSRLEPAMGTIDNVQKSFIVAQTSLDETFVGILDIDYVVERARQSQELREPAEV